MARRVTKAARRNRRLSLLVLLGVFGAGVAVWAGLALAAGPPGPPTITPSSEPASLTNVTSATFKYSDATDAGYTFTRFMCSLDGAAYVACGTTLSGSSQSYTGLSSTSHTFKVEAVYGGTTTSAAPYSWTVDTTPPKVVSISRAAGAKNPTNTGTLSWTVTFSESVTGVVSGDFGLVKSSVFGTAPSISGLSGSGAVYTVTVSATGTTGSDNGSIGLNLTSRGSIADLAGNALSASLPVVGQSYMFDTETPQAPGITSEPSSTTTSTSASFTLCDDSDNDGDSGCSDPDNLGGGPRLRARQHDDVHGLHEPGHLHEPRARVAHLPCVRSRPRQETSPGSPPTVGR